MISNIAKFIGNKLTHYTKVITQSLSISSLSFYFRKIKRTLLNITNSQTVRIALRRLLPRFFLVSILLSVIYVFAFLYYQSQIYTQVTSFADSSAQARVFQGIFFAVAVGIVLVALTILADLFNKRSIVLDSVVISLLLVGLFALSQSPEVVLNTLVLVTLLVGTFIAFKSLAYLVVALFDVIRYLLTNPINFKLHVNQTKKFIREIPQRSLQIINFIFIQLLILAKHLAFVIVRLKRIVYGPNKVKERNLRFKNKIFNQVLLKGLNFTFLIILPLAVIQVFTYSFFVRTYPNSFGAQEAARIVYAVPDRGAWDVDPSLEFVDINIDGGSFDKDAIQQSLEITPAIQGTSNWEDDQTLRFVPDEDLEPGGLYEFSLQHPSLKNGRQLMSFQTAGYPIIQYHAPKRLVEPNQDIIVSFSTSVTSFASARDQIITQNNPMSISPLVEGTYEWLTPDTLRFRPTQGFDLRQQYTVSIDNTLIESAYGLQMQQSFSWTMDKEEPVILSENLFNKDYTLQPQPSVRTNMPLDLERSNIFIVEESSQQTISVNLTQQESYSGWEVTVTPSRRLNLGQEYVIVFGPETFGRDNGASITQETHIRFRTYGVVAATIKPPLYDNTYRPSSPCIEFTAPMNRETTIQSITVNGAAINSDEVYWGWENTSICLSSYAEPSTTYNVLITNDASSIDGIPLSSSQEVTYTTSEYTSDAEIVGQQYATYEVGQPVEIWFNSLNNRQLNYSLYKVEPDDVSSPYSITSTGRRSLISNIHSKFNSSRINAWTKDISDTFPDYLNIRQEYRVDITDKLAGEGIYILVLNDQSYQVIVYSQLSLTVHSGVGNGLAWVTDTQSGLPVPGAEIFATGSGFLGATNNDGVLLSDQLSRRSLYGENDSPTLLYVHNGRHFGVVGDWWDRGLDRVNQASTYRVSERNNVGYIYTDRTLYKSGDTVHFKGYVREMNDTEMLLPSRDSINVLIEGGTDAMFPNRQLELQVDQNGSFGGSLQIPENTEGIAFSLLIENVNAETARFMVEDYEVQSFFVTVDAPTDVINGNTIKSTVRAQYYSGNPVSNARIEWQVIQRSTTTFIPSYEQYFFNSKFEDEWNRYYGSSYGGANSTSEVIFEGIGITNDQGELVIEYPASLADSYAVQLNSLIISAQDENGEFVSSSFDTTVHRADRIVGSKINNYFAAPLEEQEIEYVSLDMSSQPAPSELEISVLKRDENWESSVGVYGELSYEYTFNDRVVETRGMTLTEGKGTFNWIPQEGGLHVLQAYRNGSLVNQQFIWIRDFSISSYAFSDGAENTLDVIPDKDLYQIGENAQISFDSGFNNYSMLWLTSWNNIIDYKVQLAGERIQTIEMPVTESHLPNTFVSVTLFDGAIDSPRSHADYKIGFAEIPVDYSAKELDISVSMDKEQYKPKDEVTLSIKTSHGENTIPAGVTISVVDKALLDLALIGDRDITESMYSPGSYNVISSHSLSNSIHKYRTNLSWGSKGGGGGGGLYSSFDEADLRKEFKDTAYWTTNVMTNQNGDATATFTLPDNLTEWVIVAKAASGQDLFGQERLSFTTNLDLQIFPRTPQFFTIGDTTELGMQIMNSTSEPLAGNARIVTTFNNDEILLLDENVNIEPSSSINLEAPISIPVESSRAKIIMSFEDAEGTVLDAIELERDVLFATSYEANTYTKRMGVEAREDISISSESYGATLSVSFSPSLARNIDQEASFIKDYEYTCSEQTSSKLISYISLDRLNQLAAEERNDILLLINKIESLQLSNGGWSWWENSPHNTASLQNTIHSLYALNMAIEQGYEVSEYSITQGINFMRDAMNKTSVTDEPAKKAYGYYVMALLDVDISQDMLFEYENIYAQDNTLAHAFLALAFSEYDIEDSRYYDLIDEIQVSGSLAAQTLRWDGNGRGIFTSNDEIVTSAVSIMALVDENESSSMVERAMFWLANQSGANFNTTQTALVLNAVSDYRVEKDEVEISNSLVSVSIDNEIYCDACSEFEIHAEASQELTADFLNQLERHTYYSMTLRTYPAFNAMTPISRGLGISSLIRPVQNEEGIQVGDLVQHEVVVTVPQDQEQVLVEIPIPAGTRIINQNLSGQDFIVGVSDSLFIGEDTTDSYLPLSRFVTQERLVKDRAALLIDYLPAGVYKYSFISRAEHAGTFNTNQAKVELMYSPDIYGTGGGEVITILE